jgi:hypothetical protein
MRFFLAAAVLLLHGCGPGLVFNSSPRMTTAEMLDRADHIFVGVIQKQEFEPWLFFRLVAPHVDGGDRKYWKIARRQVRLENVLRGSESRNVVDIYEIYWTGGASGDWNFTQDGERDLFMVRVENGRYHVVRDWWRSIFPVTSGPHSRLPGDALRSLSERITLMNWWIEVGDTAASITFPDFHYNDFGGALSAWREVKLTRGLLRHPSAKVRVPACRELLMGGWGQDECWDSLTDAEKAELSGRGCFGCITAGQIGADRQRTRARPASWWWEHYGDREIRRLLTAVNYPKLRSDICRLYTRDYPGDDDTGCPADRPPPALIVRENGDMPLPGAWPR